MLRPGCSGPQAEELLAEHGLTLGHFPQSFEYASIGGFAATRSSGQASSGYGRFDALVVGLTRRHPDRHARARLRARERRRPRPAPAGARLRGRVRRHHLGHGPGPPGARRRRCTTAGGSTRSPAGTAALRTLAQSGLAPTVLRLSDENETAINLAQPDEVGGASAGGCLMIAGFEGDAADGGAARRRGRRAADVGRRHPARRGGRARRGPPAGSTAPYLRDALLDVGVLVETLETATFWSGLPGALRAR